MTIDSSAIVVAIATVVGVLVSTMTFHYQRRQYRFSALVEVFKLLNDEKHRVARRVVYNFHKGGEACVGTLSLLDLRFSKESPKNVIIEEYQQS